MVVIQGKLRPHVQAPEGGWGYAIALALIVVFVTGFSHMHSMGLLYNDFFIKTGYGVQGFTILMGVMNITYSLSGLVTSVALKFCSLRAVGFGGSFALCLGWALTMFVTQLWEITITVGLLQGLGCGIVMTASLTSFNQYFNKKRMSMIGLCKMIIGIGNMVFPVIINFTLTNYGFFGTILIMTSIVMNVFVGISLMQPVKWHQKKINDQEKPKCLEKEETQKFLPDEDKILNNKIIGMSHHLVSEEDKKYTDSMIIENQGRARALSIVSTGQAMPSCEESSNEKGSFWKSINNILDIQLFQDPIFTNICIGTSLALIIDFTFFSLMPIQLAHDKYPKDQIAYSLSVISAADLLARGAIGLIGNYVHITSRTLCMFSVVASFIFRIVYVYVEGFIPVMVLAGILGLLRSPLTVGFAIIYAEYIPEKFTAAFGLQTLVTGMLGSIITPMFGTLSDYTKSYMVTFHILNGLSLFVIIPWLIEFYITRKSVKK